MESAPRSNHGTRHRSLLGAVVAHVLIVGSLIAYLAAPSFGTDEWPVEVAQPILTENGIVISTVTYIRMVGSEWPGMAVSMVADSNAVLREGFPQPINRNAANMYGIRVKVRSRDWNFIDPVDTLAVELDLSRLIPDAADIDASSVVAATVECILTNAGRDHPPAALVDLGVRGSRAYSGFQRVYRLRSLGRLPRTPGRFWGQDSAAAVRLLRSPR